MHHDSLGDTIIDGIGEGLAEGTGPRNGSVSLPAYLIRGHSTHSDCHINTRLRNSGESPAMALDPPQSLESATISFVNAHGSQCKHDVHFVQSELDQTTDEAGDQRAGFGASAWQ